MKVCERCYGEGHIEYICSFCNGTGEGLREGTSCGHCYKNLGVVTEKCDVCEGTGEVLSPAFKIPLSIELGTEQKYLEVQEIAEDQYCLSVINDKDEIYDQILITIDELLNVIEKIKNNTK